MYPNISHSMLELLTINNTHLKLTTKSQRDTQCVCSSTVPERDTVCVQQYSPRERHSVCAAVQSH